MPNLFFLGFHGSRRNASTVLVAMLVKSERLVAGDLIISEDEVITHLQTGPRDVWLPQNLPCFLFPSCHRGNTVQQRVFRASVPSGDHARPIPWAEDAMQTSSLRHADNGQAVQAIRQCRQRNRRLAHVVRGESGKVCESRERDDVQCESLEPWAAGGELSDALADRGVNLSSHLHGPEDLASVHIPRAQECVRIVNAYAHQEREAASLSLV